MTHAPASATLPTMSYSLLRPLLFALDPETAHQLSLQAMDAADRLGLLGLMRGPRLPQPRTVMGLRFPNPVGLAAGLDKNGDHINALGRLGFGAIEVGTVTPRPQPGNPAPRLFRLPAAQAIINRMGFNNKGIDHLVAQVRKRDFDGILGINIGKNFDTPLPHAVDDYLIGLRKVYPHADYITINISSPNTPGLRELQQRDSLRELLQPLKQQQQRLADLSGRYVPIAVKIAPDLVADEVRQIADTLLDLAIDGVIATNTTNSRRGVEHLPQSGQNGGLSGAPLTERALSITAQLQRTLAGQLPIIAAGGIMNGDHARARLHAGAALVQVYTGFIYRGPALLKELLQALETSPPSSPTATS